MEERYSVRVVPPFPTPPVAQTPSATPEQALPLTWDLVEHSHREVHDLPVANPRLVDPLCRMAFVGAHV
jgi:hypothetical protein